MKIEAGKTYLDAQGVIVGPLTTWQTYGEHPFDWTVSNGSPNQRDRIYRADGTSKYNPNLVREVLDLPEGSFAVTRKGDKVGPLGRVNCRDTTDAAKFYYVAPQNTGGWYTHGRVADNGSESPKDIVGPWVETLTVRLELDASPVLDAMSQPGNVMTVGAVETTTKLVTEHKIIDGAYGPGGVLKVKLGTSGNRVKLDLRQIWYSKSAIAELATLLNGIADALPDPRD